MSLHWIKRGRGYDKKINYEDIADTKWLEMMFNGRIAEKQFIDCNEAFTIWNKNLAIFKGISFYRRKKLIQLINDPSASTQSPLYGMWLKIENI